jgi:superfamily I DNA/RNA helicase
MAKNHAVIVDEAQDLNALQVAMIKAINAPMTIAVGDAHQAIYGFRGADHQAMDTLRTALNIPEDGCLPLSFTRRCGTAIVDAARPYGPANLKAMPGAPTGKVEWRDHESLAATTRALVPGDLVLCRTNAPLVRMAINESRSKPVAILGADLKESLLRQLDGLRNEYKSMSPSAMAAQHQASIDYKAKAMEEDGRFEAADRMRDEAQMITDLCLEHESMDAVVERTSRLFTESVQPHAITCASIHRAKGLEADRVILLEANRIPHPRVVRSGSPFQVEQEHHLLYVAMTRARHHLIMQDGEPMEIEAQPVNNGGRRRRQPAW